MTKKEMTELFSVMLLAWPNSEMFKGGIAKLGPTIELWAACTDDIDFWTGKQAVMDLCKTLKFPPTIAEFRERADDAQRKIDGFVSRTFSAIHLEELTGGTYETYYMSLPEGSVEKEVINAMGGYKTLVIDDTHWNRQGFRDTYYALLQGKAKPLPGAGHRKELPYESRKRE